MTSRPVLSSAPSLVPSYRRSPSSCFFQVSRITDLRSLRPLTPTSWPLSLVSVQTKVFDTGPLLSRRGSTWQCNRQGPFTFHSSPNPYTPTVSSCFSPISFGTLTPYTVYFIFNFRYHSGPKRSNRIDLWVLYSSFLFVLVVSFVYVILSSRL